MAGKAKTIENPTSRLQTKDEDVDPRPRQLALWIDTESESEPSSQQISRPITPFGPSALDPATVPRRLSSRLVSQTRQRDPEELAIELDMRQTAATNLRNEQLRGRTPSTGARLEKAYQAKLELEITEKERKERKGEEKRKRIAKRLEEIKCKKEQMELEKKKARERKEKLIQENLKSPKIRAEDDASAKERILFEQKCEKECEENQKKYPIQRDVFEETKVPSRLRRCWNGFLNAVRSSSCFGGRRSNRVHPQVRQDE
ncbi:scaffold attachment factor B2-like [Lingula anatina]|uniref:Scaffold attachment factor B2-like n=1 Tax=Lingula anatina TaxID=7574 RepID=A0A1S3IS46_LINAN|nr:scaffold attachment factor B2-like [Lingula anatina]|eukprot:XP_013400354.1 scaffold attachment factor B2-like [Lingula anatina]